VDQGKAKAADYADEATRMANLYHANAMLKYFGPSGYNVLSEDEIDEYTDMVDDNS
jgi:multiple sugar transport system substrate-binding protein